MPTLPTPGDYLEALQHPASALVDPDLQGAEVAETALGLPQAITGAYAVVFPVRVGTRRWALKCFLTDAPGHAQRYRQLAQLLPSPPPTWYVAGDYQHQGIRVAGQVRPLLKMAWVEGTPLNRFVANHLDAPDVLDRLASAWLELVDDLKAHGLAHGDLQHGNIFVQEHDDGLVLKLLDYDALYLPGLKGRSSPEVGHRNYQHPDRDSSHWGAYLDHFSSLAIYVALRACRLRPDLWATHDTGENLLFSAADFYDPAGSPLFKALANVPELSRWIRALQQACLSPLEAIPPLPALREDPEAWTGRRRAARPRRAAKRRIRTRAEWTLGILSASGMVTALALAALGMPVQGGLVALAALMFVVGGGLMLYQRTSPVRRWRRLRGEQQYYARLLAQLATERAAYVQRQRDVVALRTQLQAERLAQLQDEALARRLKHHFIAEAGAVVAHKVIIRLKAAGIRSAFLATPERLAQVTGLSEESHRRLQQWRAGLVQRYQAEVPVALSPAEALRFDRYVEQQVAALAAAETRTQQKLVAQQHEAAQVAEQVAATLRLPVGRYLAYLFGLASWPVMPERPPRPKPAPPPTADAASVPPDEASAWWQQPESLLNDPTPP